MSEHPMLSICVPAFNRVDNLKELLDSVFHQEKRCFEVLICEDNSPERKMISKVVAEYQRLYPTHVRYVENKKNFGYDKNLRELIKLAKGTYCVFLGNDDVLNKGALSKICDIIKRNPNCGTIVRSYATFDKDPKIIKQVFRYFKNEINLPAGSLAIKTAFRRSVVIPGMVIHRKTADELSTNIFDGTLLYQLYLVGMILAKKDVVFTPEILALRREGNLPDFGNSKAEKEKYSPKKQTISSSLHFVDGMVKIAKYVDQKTGLQVFNGIINDLSAYSYPVLSIQVNKGKIKFLRYAYGLGKLGLARSPLFFFYVVLLLFFSPRLIDRIIAVIKGKLGHTPRISSVLRNLK